MNQEKLAQLEREKEQLLQLISLLMIPRQHPLPLRVEPAWTREMGRRLMIARLYQCPRIDKRSWRHFREGVARPNFRLPCTCISQEGLARQLAVSQSQLSRIELGRECDARIELAALYSVFGTATVYILTGWDRVRFEGFPQRRKRSA